MDLRVSHFSRPCCLNWDELLIQCVHCPMCDVINHTGALDQNALNTLRASDEVETIAEDGIMYTTAALVQCVHFAPFLWLGLAGSALNHISRPA